MAGAIGFHIHNALEHVAREQEQDSELVIALPSMDALVRTSKLPDAMKVHVRLGPIGEAGMSALKNVTAEFNRELEHALVGKKVIVQGLQLMNNNAIDNLVNVK